MFCFFLCLKQWNGMDLNGLRYLKISLLYGLIWKMNDPRVLVDILQMDISENRMHI